MKYRKCGVFLCYVLCRNLIIMSLKNIKISIALCTYNGEAFLEEQLDSYLNQKLLPDELVINDDCSTDNTVAIINDFAKNAPFPVYLEINNSNLGSTKNFERAIVRSSGDYIFLSDQDDVWKKDKIEKIISKFEEDENINLVFTNAELVDEKMQPLNKLLFDFTLEKKNRSVFKVNQLEYLNKYGNCVTGATMAFKKELKSTILPVPIYSLNIHDGWIAIVAATLGELFFFEDSLIYYRQHQNQQIGAMHNPQKNKYPFERNHQYAVNCIKEYKKLIKEEQNLNRINIYNYLLELHNKKHNHFKFRQELSKNIFKRVPEVLAYLIKGGYYKNRAHPLSFLKDIVGNGMEKDW